MALIIGHFYQRVRVHFPALFVRVIEPHHAGSKSQVEVIVDGPNGPESKTLTEGRVWIYGSSGAVLDEVRLTEDQPEAANPGAMFGEVPVLAAGD